MLLIPTTITASEPSAHRGASSLFSSVKDREFDQFERTAFDALVNCNVPSWMLAFDELKIEFIEPGSYKKHDMLFHVLKDYLTVGTDDDSLRTPLSPIVAQELADKWGCVLPTTQMVNLLWLNSTQRCIPAPWGPPYDHNSMASMSRIRAFDARINSHILEKKFSRDKRLVGHMKDVVLTNALRFKPKQVAIYGWHQLNGKRIQELYLGHSNTYYDYSHGIRFWSRECEVDGIKRDIVDVWQDANLNKILSNEGKVLVTRQPT